jgi:acyl CoA:acetate/3-ketoacid CoA transferase alpha subunit
MESQVGARPPGRSKFIAAEEAARLIFDGDTLAVGGFA